MGLCAGFIGGVLSILVGLVTLEAFTPFSVRGRRRYGSQMGDTCERRERKRGDA